MSVEELNESDNVVRYVSLTHLQGGKASGSAFRPKETGKDLSVNWLDYFGGQKRSEQLKKIRPLIRLTMGGQARLAELNVGTTTGRFTNEIAILNDALPHGNPIGCGLQFVRTPLCECEEHAADPTHCDIMTLPPPDPTFFDIIGDIIARSVIRLHPAKLKNNADLIAQI